MKIRCLQISNVLSFAHFENIDDAPRITFDHGLNILIGQNGAGKSTALEVINFIFKRVIFPQYLRNQDTYLRRNTAAPNEIKSIIHKPNVQSSYSGFRLDPHWDFQGKSQQIRIVVSLDDIDLRNIQIIQEQLTQFEHIANVYSSEALPQPNFGTISREITFDIFLTRSNNTFTWSSNPGGNDVSIVYLTRYNFFKELIEFHNMENPLAEIQPLFESFAIIGSYRNYHNFSEAVSLSSQSADQQIQSIRQSENNRSTNGVEQSEPTVFNLVRLLIAGIHFSKYGDAHLGEEAERLANEQPFLQKINSKLLLVGLKAQVNLLEKRTWQYSFSFIDLKRDRKLADINSLSAGQKAIIHLVFEAYGRGELKGGVVVIDEPEIHLHYQFQNEYLRIVEEINRDQQCQYILVTHSESLINSQTIGKVRRFALDQLGHSIIKSPVIQEDQKSLVKILDNTRSIYAFFAKKVVLVEGDSDRYLFRAIFQELYPQLNQEIAVLDIGGKGNFERWKCFFTAFGLAVYYIGDFDNVLTLDFPEGRLISKEQANAIKEALKQEKLNNLTSQQVENLSKAFNELVGDPEHITKPKVSLWKPLLDRYIHLADIRNTEVVRKLKEQYQDIDQRIGQKYADRVYILKSGAIEEYIGGPHADLNEIAKFCEERLESWLSISAADEIKSIVQAIADDEI
jgi:predicted ATP-dependent endonuclease of OLD family